MNRICQLFIAALLVLPVLAFAGVNPKNGNFYISYTDIYLESPKAKSGGLQLELTRTYNSKTSENGWFGFGWGSLYETRLVVMPDGSAVVQENGGGAISDFPAQVPSALPAGVDTIVGVAVEREQLTPEEADALRKKLTGDADFRYAQVKKYGIQTQLPVGAVLKSNACYSSELTRQGDTYRRTPCPRYNYTDYFDLDGRLIVREEDGFKITIHYDGKYPDRIEDTRGQKYFLMWTPAGRVASALTEEGKGTRYKYDALDNLLKSMDTGGNFYKYQYDDNHNLTQIGYYDGSHMDMQYNDMSLVTSVTEPGGGKTTYDYRTDPQNPAGHYRTKVTRVYPSGGQSSVEHEFKLSSNAAGFESLASVTSTQEPTPGSARTSKRGTELDERGRIKRVEKDGGGFSEYIYHPNLDKLIIVLTEEGQTEFHYNPAGDLIKASNSQGQVIVLAYDKNKRITRIQESAKGIRRELTFKYNDANKPISIKLVGKGEITVKYDAQGEIGKVESKQGPMMAMNVVGVMTTLMKVVKAGGVDLKM